MRSNKDGWKGSYWVDLLVLVVWVVAGTVGSQALGPTTAAGNVVALGGIVGALVLVLLFRWVRHEPWSTLGLARPARWGRVVAVAVPVAILFTALSHGAEVLVARWLLAGAEPDVSRFNPITGNLGALLGTLVVVWLTAALTEEIVFRGFLMGRLAAVFGGTRAAWIASLLLSSVVFGGLHLYQGAAGVVTTGFVGLLLGALYLLARRNLWLVILVHGLINTIALIIIYLGLA